VVLHSDLKILDPIWTTAYIVRNHGYLIYDTLFALDAKLEPKPQMVESWTVSDDKLTWTFKLREGLKWHDGTPVTSADVVPSIKRFTDKDVQGGLLAKFTQVDGRGRRPHLQHRAEGAVRPDAEDARQVGLGAAVRDAQAGRRAADQPAALRHHRLGARSSSRRTNGKPGEKVVYVRNPDYKPRSEPPSSLAAARSPSSTASNGSRSPTARPRSTP
jgi:peptide/nickel transport system substrate-binding protein